MGLNEVIMKRKTYDVNIVQLLTQNLVHDTLNYSEGNRIRFHVNLFGLFPSQSDNFTQIPETLSAGDGIIENLCKKNLELGL